MKHKLINLNRRRLRLSDNGQAGQALIEMALILPLLAFITMGAIEFGQVLYAAIEVSNAAKAAVEYAAMNGGNYYDTTGITAAANADAYDVTNSSGFFNTAITIPSGYPSISCSCTGGETCTVNTAPAPPSGCTTHMIVTVTVHTQATVTPMIHIGRIPMINVNAFPTTMTLTGSAQAQVIP